MNSVTVYVVRCDSRIRMLSVHVGASLDGGTGFDRYALCSDIEAAIGRDSIKFHRVGRGKLHIVACDIHRAAELVVGVGEVYIARPEDRRHGVVISANGNRRTAVYLDVVVSSIVAVSRILLSEVAVTNVHDEIFARADLSKTQVVGVVYRDRLSGFEIHVGAEIVVGVIEDNVPLCGVEGCLACRRDVLAGGVALLDIAIFSGDIKRALRVNAAKEDGVLVNKRDVGAGGLYQLVVLEVVIFGIERNGTARGVTGIGGGELRSVIGGYRAGLGDVARTGREIERTVCGERADYEAAGGVDDRDSLALALDRANRVRLGSERDVIGRAAKRKSRRVDDLPVCGSRLFGATVEGKRAGVDGALRLGELAANRDILGRLSNHCAPDGSTGLSYRAGNFEIGSVAIKRATCGGLRDIASDLLRVDRTTTVLDDGRRLDAVGTRDIDGARAVLRNRHAGGVD